MAPTGRLRSQNVTQTRAPDLPNAALNPARTSQNDLALAPRTARSMIDAWLKKLSLASTTGRSEDNG